MNSLDFVATVPFDVKRAVIVGGKRGDPVTVGSGTCTPIEPTTQEIAIAAGLSSPLNMFQAYTAHTDIEIGDTIATATKSYQLRGLAKYEWAMGETSVALVLERVAAPEDVEL